MTLSTASTSFVRTGNILVVVIKSSTGWLLLLSVPVFSAIVAVVFIVALVRPSASVDSVKFKSLGFFKFWYRIELSKNDFNYDQYQFCTDRIRVKISNNDLQKAPLPTILFGSKSEIIELDTASVPSSYKHYTNSFCTPTLISCTILRTETFFY